MTMQVTLAKTGYFAGAGRFIAGERSGFLTCNRCHGAAFRVIMDEDSPEQPIGYGCIDCGWLMMKDGVEG